MSYTKSIEQSDTGMVVAQVFSARGTRVGLAFIHWPPFFQARRLKRAHAWADRWMSNCRAYCIEQTGAQSEGEGS